MRYFAEVKDLFGEGTTLFFYLLSKAEKGRKGPREVIKTIEKVYF